MIQQDEILKCCSKCGKWKPRIKFWKDASNRDGLRYYCNECGRAYNNALRAKNREKTRELSRTYRLKRKEKNKERDIAHNLMKGCPECGKLKSQMEFHRDIYSQDGLNRQCKECRKENRKEYTKSYRLKNEKRNNGRNIMIGSPKKCTKCEKTKPREAFYKQVGVHDGLSSHCKECVRPSAKERMGKEKPRAHQFLWHKGSGFLCGDGCCMWCFEINPFMLHNHHIWGRKNSDEIYTFCANCHALFGKNKPRGILFGFFLSSFQV